MADPKTKTVKVGGIEYVMRRPTYAEWRAYKAGVVTSKVAEEGSHLIDAQEQLAKACCVSHKPSQLDDHVEEELDLFSTLSDAAASLAGNDDKARRSKS